MERVRRFEVKLVLCIETRSRNVVHARPKRLRSVVLYFCFILFSPGIKARVWKSRTPFWNWVRRSRRRRSNSPDFLNLVFQYGSVETIFNQFLKPIRE